MRLSIIAISVLILIGVGFVFVGGASPFISVAPEVVFHAGGIGITNTMFTSWFVVLVLILIAYIAGRGAKVVPSGFSGAVEAAIVVFYDLVVSVAGEKNGRRFFPVIATIFFFILMSNYMGLLPINNVIGKPEPNHGVKQAVLGQRTIAGIDMAYIPFKPDSVDTGAGEAAILADEAGEPFSGVIAPYFRSVMTDVNAPLAIAIWSFIFVEFWAFSVLGLGYLTKFFNFSRLIRLNPMGIIDVFVGVLEFVSELSRMVSFTFRLFGNIFAGEVLLLMGMFLVPFVLVDVFYGLELFVGLIQAFVFAMLTLVFAQTAVTFSHGDGHGEEHGAGH
ncbi:MAG: F0F1 ATP synthase subunit A [Chloroflexi bacterium]|nr:F0F1 ATP synthase subunit A [Chloroflexota bacterium]MDA1001906.1 F0F1 ATP synthase subunit A [Chloroflexota bacterium]MQC27796.1 ATP synthase F0 subunit A [Chloroflexota bacterium]